MHWSSFDFLCSVGLKINIDKLLFSPRLNLPGKITEDGRESASYDVEKGDMYILCVSNRGRGHSLTVACEAMLSLTNG